MQNLITILLIIILLIIPAIKTSQKHQPKEKNSMDPSILTTKGTLGSEAQYPPAAAHNVTPSDAIA